ncbi:SGNH/GDSL hydrolase family protein [Streptomyces lichenis]|uniref:SGNH/GDSL hydrolase family protein n=1 Tax=Streptomyces lichenis TaxID=2306967 RepID=A0ABT0IK10_9ACTN|nr:SGNH/GDSL hydrolase family protein [Streptomyces lichenis]MCK8681615.1 SGNH/GDSL hydrolase family protein [Streptomyces lichenis]
MRPATPSRRLRTALALTTATAALAATAALGAAPAAATPTAVTASTLAAPGPGTAALGTYVALGDSFASGAGVPEQTDTGCARSSRNYPALLNAELAPTAHRDVTCGGATTVHLTSAQSPTAPPQFDALSADTDLVTLTIGGNDIGFADIIVRCVTLGLLDINGRPCRTSYTWTGQDQLAAAIRDTAPRIAAAIDGVRARAPKARVLVTGYPAILPDDGGNCPFTVSIAKGDAPWLRDTHKRLNTMIAQSAAAQGADYVDTYTPSIGHDACKPAGTRWMEPLFTSAAAPFHPNAAGERAMADAVHQVLATR